MELRGFGDRTLASQRLHGPSLSERLWGSRSGWQEIGPEAYRSALLLQGRSGSLLEEHAGSQLSQQLAVCSLQCRSGPEPLVGSPSHSPVEAAAQILPASDGPCQAMSGLDAQQAPGHRCLHRGFGAGHNCLPEDVTWQGFLVQLLQGSVSRGTGVGKGLHA